MAPLFEESKAPRREHPEGFSKAYRPASRDAAAPFLGYVL